MIFFVENSSISQLINYLTCSKLFFTT